MVSRPTALAAEDGNGRPGLALVENVGHLLSRLVQLLSNSPIRIFVQSVRKALSTSLLILSSIITMPSSSLISGAILRHSISASTTTTTSKSAFLSKFASLAAILSGAPQAAHASALKRSNQNLTPYQKLATTPLFFVTNTQGLPYLQQDMQAGKPEQAIIVYFMSSEDADDYLNELAQGNHQNINEFRMMTTSMEKVMKKIQLRKQSRKLGRFPIANIIRIQPSSRQCENAEIVVGKSNSQVLQGLSIPMFTARGMLMERSSGELVAPYYFAYEDLLDDWAKIEITSEGKGKKVAATPKVEVKDFVDVMCLSQGISTESLKQIAMKKSGGGDSGEREVKGKEEKGAADIDVEGFSKEQIAKALKNPAVIPPRREIDMVRSFYRNKAGIKNEFQTARIMGPSRN